MKVACLPLEKPHTERDSSQFSWEILEVDGDKEWRARRMRKNTIEIVNQFSRIFAAPEPIIEIGALQVEGQSGPADLRGYFPQKKYIGVDMRPGPGVDQTEDFERRTSFSDQSVSTIITLDTLEHVYDTFHFVEEVNRILAPGGLFLMVSVMYYPIHDHPFDHWRFTPETFRRLVAPIGEPLICTQGAEDFPHTVIALVRKDGALTEQETTQFREAVRTMELAREGCNWVSPAEQAMRDELVRMRAYHAQWGKVSVSGFHEFNRREWARETADSAFDPNVSRWQFVSQAWKKSRWLGLPTGQLPTDLMSLQEIMVEVRPKTIIEVGAREEGTTAFFATLLSTLHGREASLIRIDPQGGNETSPALTEAPFSDILETHNADPLLPKLTETLRQRLSEREGPVLVFLNAGYSARDTRAWMENYQSFVSPNSYLIICNTVARYLFDVPGGHASWEKESPYSAVQDFLLEKRDFVPDRTREKHMASFLPMGFLRRLQKPDASAWQASASVLESGTDDRPSGGEPVSVVCTTLEGDRGVWGGLTMGCERNNVCDGKTLECSPASAYRLRFYLKGVANWAGVNVALNVIDDAHQRLNETVLELKSDWTRIELDFATRQSSRFLGVQLVKARSPIPAVFTVKGLQIDRRSTETG
jgi:cephalosporin hydroxylase